MNHLFINKCAGKDSFAVPRPAMNDSLAVTGFQLIESMNSGLSKKT